MTILQVHLQPIARAWDFSGALSFRAPPGSILPFAPLDQAQRLYAQFRLDATKDGAPEAVVDSVAGTLTATGPAALAFTLTGAQTALFVHQTVDVDFGVRGADGKWRPLPLRIHWPVIRTVTRPPA